MDIETALQNIQQNRRAILFLGAGFSSVTKNKLGTSTPSGSQLADRILQHIKIPGSAPLGLAIDKLREKLSPVEGFEFINNQLTVQSITPEQHEILSLPWTRIYTTNVDNIGNAFTKRKSHDAAIEQKPTEFGDFVSLHGSISNCTPTNFYKNLKLGEQVYLSGTKAVSGYRHQLEQDLYECDAVFVIGYSMADPDLAQIFFNSEDLLNKCFVFSGHTDEITAHRISLIGNNTELDLSDLIKLIRSRKTSIEHSLRPEIIFDRGGFEKREVTQTARQNMLVYGRFDVNIARTAWINGGETYVVKRKLAEDLSTLSAPRILVVHSHLGNGKSLIFEYARFLMARSGKTVFTIKPDVSGEKLLEVLKEIPTSSHVFFEGDVFSIAKAVGIIRDRSLIFFATSRSTTIRVVIPSLATATLGKIPLQTIDANRINDNELREFHGLVESMGFWPPDLIKLPQERRLEKLRQDFDSNVSAIVLKVFENETLQKQILNQWSAALPGLRPIMDHFIVASYMQMIDIFVPPYILNEFQNMDFRLLSELSSDIIAVSHSGRVSFGNAIIGEFVLHHHSKKDDIIGAIVRFANFVDTHPSQRSLQWIIRRLLRYWNLSRLLKSKTQPNEVLDRASYIPSVNSDPLFWVQYSIAQMENDNFLAAERYLATAYAKAGLRGSNFDPYQIDTHAARLVIRKITSKGMYDGSANDVLNSVSKLRAVIQRRPNDIYHVATVTSQVLKAEIDWGYVLNDRDFHKFKQELKTIAEKLITPGGDITFAPEREALRLIQSLLEPKS